MALVTQALDDLLGGVSQQPAPLRDASQGTEQVNGTSSAVTGLSKRPPLKHVGVILATPPGAAYGSAHVHTVLRSSTDRYRVVLVNGDLKVFDVLTNAEQTVVFPVGKTYLVTTDPTRDLRCVTVGDTTYIVNRTIVTARDTVITSVAKNEALVSIRQADFATVFSITLNDATISYTTVVGVAPSDRVNIGTEIIAEKLRLLIAGSAGMAAFTATRYGSTLYIKRNDGADFTISASDGLADVGILAIKGSVQRFDDLPERAKNGFIVEISGDPSNQFDNYYVRYDDNGLPNLAGVWKECAKPGILTSLSKTTMPHILKRGESLLDGSAAESVPASPTVVADSTLVTFQSGFDSIDSPSADTYTANPYGSVDTPWQESTVALNNQYASAVIPGLNGSKATISVNFSVDTRSIPTGGSTTLEMWISNTASVAPLPRASYTKVTSMVFRKGGWLDGQTLSYVAAALPANTRIQVRQVESPAGALGYGSARFSFYATLPWTWFGYAAPAGITVTRSIGQSVIFPALADYPAGCAVVMTVAGTPYTHTTVAGSTGTSIAAALAPLVVGTYTATADAGVVSISGAPTPTITVTVSFSPTTTFFNAALALITNALVGRTINNLSDGSSGTITANTTNTITVAALTGGGTNKFSRGDLCTVDGADATVYTFTTALWKPRVVGDTLTIPAPSFIGSPVDEVFYTKNRLGLASKNIIVLSQAGVPLNLFRQTATALLPDDVIDVKFASQGLANFHSAIHWNEKLLLFSSNGQVILDGEPNMTPETVSLTQKSEINNSTRMRPVAAGNKLFFARGKGASTQVLEYGIVDQTGAADANDITKHVLSYLPGTPVAMTCDPQQGFLAVLTDADRSKLFVYYYDYNSQTLVQSAWSRWEFNADTRILAIDIVDAQLALVVKRTAGVYLEVIDLDPLSVAAAGNTDALLSGNVPYTFSYTLSTLFKRGVDRSGRPIVDHRGRLTIRYLTVKFHNTTNFTVTVTPDGRAPYTYTFSDATQTGAGTYRIPVLCRNLKVGIVITNATTGSTHIDGIEWEGTHATIATRV